MTITRRRSAARVALAALALGLVPAATVVAPTTTSSAACPSDIRYALSSSNVRMPYRGMTVFKDGPGGSVTVTRSQTGSISYTVTAGAEAEVNTVFAKAKVSVSASLTKSDSTTTSHGYTHSIPRGKYGHLQYVNWGKRVVWKKMRDRPDCTTEVIGRGVIKFPTGQEGWYFWSTSS